MPSPFPSLCLGLALGGAVTWFALRPSASATSISTPALPASVAAPAWSWRESPTPPRFATDSAAAAISGWLGLRATDGRPASYAARAASLRALVLRLPANAFPRLLEPLSRSETDEDRRLRRIAFSAWAAQDAPAATRWAVAQGEKSNDIAGEGLGVWIAKDPAAAAAWACALNDDKLARQFASRALGALAEKNPDRALALARSRDDAFRDAVISSVIDSLGKKDPVGTLRTFAPEIWENGDGFWKLRSTIAAWMKQDSSAALAWLMAQPRDPERNELSYWFGNLGDNSPGWRRTVADALATNPNVKNRAGALRNLVFQWGTNQPDEALAWIRSLPDPDLRITLLERISGSYQTNNPEKTLPLLLAMPDGANRSQALARRLGAWAKINPEAALAWMKNNQAEPGVAAASQAVHGTLVGELARDDPQAAIASWRELTDPKAKETARNAIMKAWGEKDPAAALRWAESQQQADQNRYYSADRELVYRWGRTEPEAALRWIEDLATRLPQGQSYLAGEYFEALGGNWNEKAPRAATADLYTRIKDPALRLNALNNHVREWLTKDPEGARAWVAASPALTPEQRASLLAERR